jgi:hypothetical protein
MVHEPKGRKRRHQGKLAHEGLGTHHYVRQRSWGSASLPTDEDMLRVF